MRYAEYAPTPRCARLVERFWLLEGHATGTADAIIPDGRIELVFHYRGCFWRHVPHSPAIMQPGSLLVGQMIHPVIVEPEGHAAVAAIRLRPAAARTLLGFPLREVSGRFIDLESIFPSAVILRERLAEAINDRERVDALEGWLITMVCPLPRSELEAAVGTILRSGGQASIDGLATMTNLGVRQLERQFHDEVGLSPKTFSRIVRLQVALKRIRGGEALSEVALACGFYDQSHMTRDFRQLAAMSPGAWQVHAGDLAPLFVGGELDRLSDRSVLR